MKNLLLTTLLFLSFAHAETFQCKVVGITDGDTITCLTDQKKQVKVRLYQIDAPEGDQAYGQKVKQALSDMFYGHTVEVEKKGVDKYNKILGRFNISLETICFFDDKGLVKDVVNHPNYDELIHGSCLVEQDFNLDMIKQGYAWYKPFDGENPEYQQAEQEAKAAKRGLWADKYAMPPWEWEKDKKK